jgi:hypothetical protein
MRAERKDIEAAIAKLSDGKDIVYKLSETFGGEFVHVVLNQEGKGKYAIVLEKQTDGKPTGQKSVFLTTDSASFVAKWCNNMWAETV